MRGDYPICHPLGPGQRANGGYAEAVRFSGRVLLAIVSAALTAAAPAAAADWLPHPADATWTYQWTDSVYNTTPTTEKVTVTNNTGAMFTLGWTTVDQGNSADAPTSVGDVVFQETGRGLVNTDWQSNQPPSSFPVLCATITQCGNSLASTYYNVIWGARAPTLVEPLLKGTSWSSTGGFQNDVTSQSTYMGTEQITVPAFPMPVVAAKVQTQVTQAGALGDPYGSGVRTVWWVYGVGPVKVEFQHEGGNAPLTSSVLQSTNQTPLPPPPDANYFPLKQGAKFTYRWTNTKHLAKPSVTTFVVDQVSNGSARMSVKNVSGPIKLAGAYGFTLRTDGLSNLWSATQSATKLKFPALGPTSAPVDQRRHFITPFDLMIYGFNPILPAYGTPATTWSAVVPSRDYSIFGVTGTSTVIGTQKVTVPAGTFNALVVRSTLAQAGFTYGSGTRTSWFAPNKGLVKLVFRHADGSTSTVELLH